MAKTERHTGLYLSTLRCVVEAAVIDALIARAEATKMTALSQDIFKPWIERWSLVADGLPFTSNSRSQLLPVLSGGEPAMLKVSTGEEAYRGAGLLAWYAGEGAARVLAREGPILLLERLSGDDNGLCRSRR